MPLRLAVLVSGRGSNLRALSAALPAELAPIVLVLADRRRAAALEWAASSGIPTAVCRVKDHPSREAWDAALAAHLDEAEPDLVVSAGFLKILGPAVLGRYRAVNVHPSLLPSFKGLSAPAQALAAGARVSGCTVHLVDEGTDTGPTLAQAAVPVQPGDDAASLHARIQRVEHRLLPAVVRAVADGRLTLGPPPVWQDVPGEGELISPAIC
jgi:phosphoribosylglycinamide formyltransferase-1